MENFDNDFYMDQESYLMPVVEFDEDAYPYEFGN